jgi:hypothetical protein
VIAANGLTYGGHDADAPRAPHLHLLRGRHVRLYRDQVAQAGIHIEGLFDFYER